MAKENESNTEHASGEEGRLSEYMFELGTMLVLVHVSNRETNVVKFSTASWDRDFYTTNPVYRNGEAEFHVHQDASNGSNGA